MRKFTIAVITLAVLAVGLAIADDPVNQTYETQGLSASTAVIVQGAVTNAESIVWIQSNRDMTESSLDVTMERQYTMSYIQSISGNNGYAEYNGVNTLDTANKVANQNNFKSTKQFDYMSFDEAFGQVATSESLLLDGVGSVDTAPDKFLCPFAASVNKFPPYCNIIEMGSTFSGVAVSMTNVASERHVANSADVPVVMDYSVGLSGQGAASAWIRAHLQEGRGTEDKGMDLVYSEKVTASGVIASFSKAMSYQSGARRF
ncbi:MAG: hypothetical protein NQU46_06680 [Methanolinea sp.]|nr:hypothetical protein [Methanolinea sp.]